jgi:hypothetical protein
MERLERRSDRAAGPHEAPGRSFRREKERVKREGREGRESASEAEEESKGRRVSRRGGRRKQERREGEEGQRAKKIGARWRRRGGRRVSEQLPCGTIAARGRHWTTQLKAKEESANRPRRRIKYKQSREEKEKERMRAAEKRERGFESSPIACLRAVELLVDGGRDRLDLGSELLLLHTRTPGKDSK